MTTSYGQRRLTSSLARRYYRQMKAGYAQSAQNARRSQPSSINSYISKGIADYSANNGSQTSTPSRGGNPSNPASWIIDVLSQPIYAFTENMADMGEAALKAKSGRLQASDVVSALNMFDDYGSGNKKILPSAYATGQKDVWNELMQRGGNQKRVASDVGPLAPDKQDNGIQKVLKGTGAFATDILFDPLTYITLGTAGAAVKGVGLGLKATEAASRVGAVGKAAEGLERAGQAAVKTDQALNALPGKVIKGAVNKVRPGTFKSKAAEIVDELIAPKAEAPSTVPEVGFGPTVKDPLTRGVTTPETRAAIEALLGEAPQRTLTAPQRMLKSTVDDTVVPYSANEAKKRVVPEYDWRRVQSENGRFLTPFEREQVPHTNKAPMGSDNMELPPAAAEQEARTVAAEVTNAALKKVDEPVTLQEQKEWFLANKDSIEVTINGVTHSATEWQNRLFGPAAGSGGKTLQTRRDLFNKALKQKAAEGVRAARARAVPGVEGQDVLSGMAPRNADSLTGASGPGEPAGGSSPLEAAQRVAEAGGTSRNWTQKTSAERARIKKRYQRLLEDEHFKYLYENQARTDWTDAQKQKDFISRLSHLKRGKAINQPRYVEFYQTQIINTPGATFEAVQEGTAKLLSDRPAAYNEALSQVTPAAEIMDGVDTSIEATVQREAQRVFSGQELDDISRSILRHRLGAGDATVPGQQWDKLREDFGFVTNVQKTARDSEVFGVGHGINRESFNGKVQQNIFGDLIVEANEALSAQGLLKAGYAGAPAKYEFVVSRLKKIEEFMRAHGIEPTGGTAKQGVPISLADTLEALVTTKKGRTLVYGRIFGGAFGIGPKGVKQHPGTIYVDSLMRVMGAVVENIDATAINAARNNIDLLDATARAVAETIRGKRGTELSSARIAKILTDNGKTPISTARKSVTQGATEVKVGQGYPVDVKVTKKGKAKPYFGPYSAQVVKELEDVLFNSIEYGKADFRVITALAQTVQQRAAQYGIRFGDNVRQLSEKSMREVFDLVDSQPTTKEMVDLLGDPDEIVKAVGKTKIIEPTSEELMAAQARLDEDLNDVLSLWDRKNIEAFKGVTRGVVSDATSGGRTATNRAMMNFMKNAEDEIRSANPNMTPEELSILDAEILDTTSTSMRAALWFTNTFVPSKVINASGKMVTTNRFHDAFRATGSLGRNLSREINKTLSQINRQFSREEIQAGYKYLQRGMRGQVDPRVRAAAEAIKPVNSMFFDHAGGMNRAEEGILLDFFNRGYDLKHVADKMAASNFGIPEHLQFDWDAVANIADPKAKIAALHKQWAQMNIDNPLDYLSRLDATIGNLSMDVALSQQTWKKLNDFGLVSRKPQPGYVKLNDLEHNYITRYFPESNGTYFVAKDAVPELVKLNKLLHENTSYGPGMFGAFMRGYSPILNMWKSGMTIWRTGHHIRNLVGDASLSFLSDGVKDPRYYVRAIKFLSERKSYDAVDMLAMLRGLPPARVRDTRYVLKASLGNGRKIEVADDLFYEAMYRRGVIKDFAAQEDLMEVSQIPKVIQKAQSAIQLKGKYRGTAKAAVGRASEARDDFVRLAHALHLLENKPQGVMRAQKQYKTVDELFDAIAARVNQVHPDGTDLTGFERKWMRQAVPFYSWMRKAIPLVVEAGLQHPGRITAYPKFVYAQAQQMGIESDSLSDPFPEDQLFPSWITDQITGPVYQGDNGDYYGVNPGEVSSDLLNQFLGGNAKNEILDMMNPFVKLPIELQTGKTLGQGIQTPGADPLQYIGSQVPGISHAQSLAGVDILGSLGTVPQGNGLDPTLSVQRGNRDPIEENTILNYFLGLGSQNMSTQAAKNAAEIERRNAAARRQ